MFIIIFVMNKDLPQNLQQLETVASRIKYEEENYSPVADDGAEV